MNSSKQRPQEIYRTSAAIAGVLYIVGTVSGIVSAVIGKPVLNAPDYLVQINANETRVLISALLQSIMGVACAGISFALYPIIRRYHEGLAIGSAGFRMIEGTLDIVGALFPIALLALSREFIHSGAVDAGFYQTTGALITASSEWLNNIAVLLTWSIGALLYYSVFYRYRIVPRWISGWGLVSFSLTFVSCLLVAFRLLPAFGIVQVIANAPIGLQEMVLAVWLIARGVNLSAGSPALSQQIIN